jgi:hypothetical protein
VTVTHFRDKWRWPEGFEIRDGAMFFHVNDVYVEDETGSVILRDLTSLQMMPEPYVCNSKEN